MNWYNNYKNEWKEIVESFSFEMKRNPIMIEKDIIQSMLLYELSQSDLPFVFKGGTSLSKAYRLIDRDLRHLYDIAKIIPNITLSHELKELIVKVRMDRSKSSICK